MTHQPIAPIRITKPTTSAAAVAPGNQYRKYISSFPSRFRASKLIQAARLCLAVLLGAIVLSSPAQAQSWVDDLRSVRGDICCANNDGRRLDDPDWDTLGKVNGELSGYRVHEVGQWHEVPAASVIIMRNKDGIARLWWNLTTDDAGYVTGRSIRCFLPGATG